MSTVHATHTKSMARTKSCIRDLATSLWRLRRLNEIGPVVTRGGWRGDETVWGRWLGDLHGGNAVLMRRESCI